MADEEDENQPKVKKKEDKDWVLELAPGDVVNPVEYKIFDQTNMLHSLNIPGKRAYNFQKELSTTIQRRLEAIRMRLGSDDVAVTDNDKMELMAGLQTWEEVDPVTGHLLELKQADLAKKMALEPKATLTGDQKATTGIVTQLTPSVLTAMRAALPKPKQEDKRAMPPANRRVPATPKLFEGLLKAQEKAEFGDYYETIDKWDREWKEVLGRRPSELVKADPKLEVKPTKTAGDQKKGSSFAKTSSFFKEGTKLGVGEKDKGAPAEGEKPDKEKRMSVKITAPPLITVAPPTPTVTQKKAKPIKKPAGTPAFMDATIDYFLANVSPDCDLEAWLAPINIVPVFKIRDIPPEIENCILTIARATHSKFVDEQVMASQIRGALEKHHGYACRWHVIIGRKFGLQVNADKNNFLFMYIGHLGYVVFRTFG